MKAMLSNLSMLAVLAGPTASQATSGCNNLTRHMEIVAGNTQPTVAKCTKITISVGGASITTPEECIVAYTVQTDSVWSCGPAATGLNCNPNASRAWHSTYHDGGCPSIAGLTDGMTFDSWEDVPLNLFLIINGMSTCVLPQRTDSYDWSAKCTTCPIVNPPGYNPIGESSDHKVSGAIRWQGNPWDAFTLSADSIESYNPFETDCERSMEGEHVSNVALGRVLDSGGELGGAHFDVDVELRHFGPDGSSLENERLVQRSGSITIAGTFDWLDTFLASNGDERAVLQRRYAFDGTLLATETLGTEEGSAYGRARAYSDHVWDFEIMPESRYLHKWLSDPYRVKGFSSYRFREIQNGKHVLVEKLAPGKNVVDKRYILDPSSYSTPVVRETVVLDPDGLVRERMRFDRFVEITPGVMRPMHIVHELYLDPRRDHRRVETVFQLHDARKLTPEQVVGVGTREFQPSHIWNVWL